MMRNVSKVRQKDEIYSNKTKANCCYKCNVISLVIILQTIFVNSDTKNMKDDHLYKFEFGSRGIKYDQTTNDFGQTVIGKMD